MSYLRASSVKSYTATVVVALHWYRGGSTDLGLPSMADIGASASNSRWAPRRAGGVLFAIPANSDLPELPPPDEPFGSLILDDMDVDIPAVPAPEQAESANAGEEAHGGQQEDLKEFGRVFSLQERGRRVSQAPMATLTSGVRVSKYPS